MRCVHAGQVRTSPRLSDRVLRLIGSKTIAILRQGANEVVAASPKRGINTITGEGVKEDMAGAQAILNPIHLCERHVD